MTWILFVMPPARGGLETASNARLAVSQQARLARVSGPGAGPDSNRGHHDYFVYNRNPLAHYSSCNWIPAGPRATQVSDQAADSSSASILASSASSTAYSASSIAE